MDREGAPLLQAVGVMSDRWGLAERCMQSTRAMLTSTGAVSGGGAWRAGDMQTGCAKWLRCPPALITQRYIRRDADLLAMDGSLYAACLSSQDSVSQTKGIDAR